MKKYKIIGQNSDLIRVVNGDGSITTFSKESWEYNEFLAEVKSVGIASCVEGPTVGVTTDYRVARVAEYPSIEDQLDKIYHTSLTAWKADIKAIKDKYPKTQVGVTTIAAVPDWVQTEVDKL